MMCVAGVSYYCLAVRDDVPAKHCYYYVESSSKYTLCGCAYEDEGYCMCRDANKAALKKYLEDNYYE